QEDIPLLADFFCEKFARPNETKKHLSADAMELLLRHPWPGNVRELENVLERACVTCPGPTIEAKHLSPDLSQLTVSSSPFRIDLNRKLPDLLRELTADV